MVIKFADEKMIVVRDLAEHFFDQFSSVLIVNRFEIVFVTLYDLARRRLGVLEHLIDNSHLDLAPAFADIHQLAGRES